MFILAYAKLRYSTPIYVVNAKLMVKNNSQGGTAGDKFDDIFLMQGVRNNMNDEMEIIKSRYMAKRVITKLNFQYQYYNQGQLRSSLIHPLDMPFLAEIKLADSSSGSSLSIKIVDNTQFTIGESAQKYFFGQWIKQGADEWRLNLTGRNFSSFSKEFVVAWVPLDNISAELSGSIKVVKLDNFSNVLNLSYQTPNTAIGRDILNQYMQEYKQYNLEDKREIAINTLEFIDEQLDTVKGDLGRVEQTLKDFRERNKVIDPDGQAQLYLSNINESSKLVTEQVVKIKIADQLINYINDEKNPFRVVPTSLGILEPSLVQQITEYNRLLLQRESTLLTTPPANPIVIGLEASIAKLRSDMLDNLRNIRRSYGASVSDYERNSVLSEQQVRTVPGVQKRLLEISRQQKILEELYSYLLQKKLETSIGSASTISAIRVVEPAFSSNRPVQPDKRSVYLLSLFIGLLIPAVVIFLLEYLNDRVQTKNDVQKVTDAPILGEVGHSEDSQTLVVGKNNRKVVAEQFRMIRTNLQYILHDKEKMVIMVTSSFGGEGKSFVSTNIGAVLALTGKRTVLLEFDIRKPKILHGLGLSRSNGITNYVVGACDLEDLPVPVPQHNGLFVIPCGPVPPNPSELLLDAKILKIFNYCRDNFDAIIIDTAPVGLVSDAITLGKHADATIYIVRHDYTQKRQIQLIQDIYVQGKLPSMSVVINDIKVKLGYGGYYGYGGYGYGYGYGYGRKSNATDATSYYGVEDTPKRKFWRFFRKKKYS
jgi:capsular exopolysaccharide synthesis family protein